MQVAGDLERRHHYRTSTPSPRRPQAPVHLPDKTIIRAQKYITQTKVRKAAAGPQRARRHRDTAQDHRTCTPPGRGMGATVHLTGVLGVASPPLARSHCSAKKQSCSLRQPPRQQQQRRRLRVARAVEVGAPSAGAPEPEEVETPSIDFAFVSVSSSRSRLLGPFCF